MYIFLARQYLFRHDQQLRLLLVASTTHSGLVMTRVLHRDQTMQSCDIQLLQPMIRDQPLSQLKFDPAHHFARARIDVHMKR